MATIKQLEAKRGVLVLDLRGRRPDEEISEQDFAKLATLSNCRGVDHDSRIAFLKGNGYEVTRENMLDGSLSAQGADAA